MLFSSMPHNYILHTMDSFLQNGYLLWGHPVVHLHLMLLSDAHIALISFTMPLSISRLVRFLVMLQLH